MKHGSRHSLCKFRSFMALFKSPSHASTVNLLELKPLRSYEWENPDGQRVTVLVPRFGYPRLMKWLSPRLAQSRFRVRLDDFGSFVWLQCDGRTTVAEISERLRSRFGGTVEPVYDRVCCFMQRLLRDQYVSAAARPGCGGHNSRNYS